MSRYAPELILMIVLIAGYFAYRSYSNHVRFNEYVQESFVKPYTDLIMAGREAEAYERYTHSDFKKKYPLNTYLKSYEDLRRSRGRHVFSNFISKQSETVNVLNNEKVYFINMGYSFEQSDKILYLEIIAELVEQEAGGFLMKNSYSAKRQYNPEGLTGPW